MLIPEQIIKKAHEAGLYQDGINTQLPLWVLTQQELERFTHAIEAEVRQQDDELIQKMLEALNTCDESDGYTGLRQFFDEKSVESAITAARKRLENT